MESFGPDVETMQELERRRSLTAAYSRYSRSAAGLGTVLGGVLCMLVFAVHALVPLAPNALRFLAATPLVWLAMNVLLRRRFYQQLGRVEAVWTPEERKWRVLRTAFIAAVAAFCVGYILWKWRFFAPPSLLGYLLVAPILPLLAWHLGNREEFIIGMALFCQAAVVLAGAHYSVFSLIIAISFSVRAIITGLRQHADFRRIAGELAALEPVA